MSYLERAYFENDHCAHCGAFEEARRLQRKRTDAMRMMDRRR